MAAYLEEIKHLRQKVRDLEEREARAEKTAQKKHAYYIVVEQKYRDICQQYGIEPMNPSGTTRKNITFDLGQGKHLTRGDVTRSDANVRLLPKKTRTTEDDEALVMV